VRMFTRAPLWLSTGNVRAFASRFTVFFSSGGLAKLVTLLNELRYLTQSVETNLGSKYEIIPAWHSIVTRTSSKQTIQRPET